LLDPHADATRRQAKMQPPSAAGSNRTVDYLAAAALAGLALAISPFAIRILTLRIAAAASICLYSSTST